MLWGLWMKKILIVDDDSDLLLGLREALQNESVKTEVFSASCAEEGLEIIAGEKIDLLITDVHMPGMNGPEMVVAVKKNHPHLPVIIMTAFPSPENEKQAMLSGCLRFLEKPFDLADFKASVQEALGERKGFDGTVAGIELQDLIQLHCLSHATAAVKVSNADKMGMIFFAGGNIVHAILDDLQGEEAFYEIMAFAGGSLESTKNVNPPVKTIKKNHMALLMEGMRRMDESGGNTRNDEDDVAQLDAGDLLNDDGVSVDWFGAGGENRSDDELSASKSFSRQFAELKKVLGYKAAAIMTLPGEMLASESLDDNIDLASVGITLNEIFREAHEAILKIGMEKCIETVIETTEGVIVMHSTGSQIDDLHMISILSLDGNKSLMKMKMAQLMPSIKDAYSN